MIPLLGIYPKEMKTYVHLKTFTYYINTIIIAKQWKQLKCPLPDKWINKMYSIQWKYYLVIKMKNQSVTAIEVRMEVVPWVGGVDCKGGWQCSMS